MRQSYELHPAARIHQTDGDGASGEAEYPGQHRTQLDTAPEGKRRAGYGDGERERSLLKKTKVTKKTRAHAYIMYVRVCEKKGPASAASASAFRISGCDAGIPVDLPVLPENPRHSRGSSSILRAPPTPLR